MAEDNSSLVTAINTISSFLANEHIHDVDSLISHFNHVSAHEQSLDVDVIVFCASAVLYTAEAVFSAFRELERNDNGQVQQGVGKTSRVVLVLCGGIGHSTHYIHEAVARHPKFNSIAKRIYGQPEAQVLRAIAEEFFELGPAGRNESDILIEDKSTNCGANASFSKRLLEEHGIAHPRSIVVVQDPTMCRRTAASFERLHDQDQTKRPEISCWPTFVPLVHSAGSNGGTLAPLDSLSFDTSAMTASDNHDLWDMARFADLIMGEIPRLRDDSEGYGPQGKGFIAHVDIPEHVEEAWETLRATLGSTNRAG